MPLGSMDLNKLIGGMEDIYQTCRTRPHNVLRKFQKAQSNGETSFLTPGDNWGLYAVRSMMLGCCFAPPFAHTE